MITVNLKDLYYWCKEDVFVEITEEMLEAMKAADRQESAYKRRTYYHRALHIRYGGRYCERMRYQTGNAGGSLYQKGNRGNADCRP